MRYLDEAVKLIEQSSQKDHFFEVAGHLIQGIPETAFKLEKALQAVALAADRIDYEEIKQELRPEKVEELERVLKDVRIRPVKHRSENPMKPKEAAARLREFSKITREEGSLPLHDLATLISDLGGRPVQASASASVGDTLDRIASVLETEPSKVSREQLATILYRMAGEAEIESAMRLATKNPVSDKTANPVDSGMPVRFETIRGHAIAAARAANAARWRPALMSLFYIVDEIGTVLVELGSMDTQKSEALKREIRQMLPQAAHNIEEMEPLSVMAAEADIEKLYHEMSAHLDTFDLAWSRYEKDPEKNRAKLDDALRYMKALRTLADTVIRNLEAKTKTAADLDPWKTDDAAGEEAKRSRFEQGKPADPTENMDPEDAEAWKSENDEHKDNFKEAAGLRWKARFPRSHSSYGHFFDLDVNTPDGVYTFMIEPLLGDQNTHVQLLGKPMYVLRVHTPNAGNMKFRRQLPDIDKLKEVAENYAKTLQAPAGSVIWDGWSKTALGPDSGGSMLSKFEEGKPADPTENMSPEDAKRWKEEHDEHKDNFKSAYYRRTAADDGGFEDGIDKGKFTIILHQTGATKWTATYINPQGGSGGSSATSSAKAALQVALGRIDFKGQKTVKVLTKKLQGDNWVTTKTETVDTGAK
jgi:hypothetical protein